MTIALTVLATCVLLFAALGAAANWAIVVSQRRASMILLVSLPLSLLGCALHPAIAWYAGFLAIPLDPGCVAGLLGLPYLLRQLRQPRS